MRIGQLKREERPSASATNNHNYHPGQRSSAVGIDLTMEKKEREIKEEMVKESSQPDLS
jgi:hypothetical protein